MGPWSFAVAVIDQLKNRKKSYKKCKNYQHLTETWMGQRTFYIYKQPSSSCCPCFQAHYLSLIQLCIVYVARKCLYCTGWMNKQITNTRDGRLCWSNAQSNFSSPTHPSHPISWCELHTYQLKAFVFWHRAFKFHGSHILVVTDCWRLQRLTSHRSSQPAPTRFPAQPLTTLPTSSIRWPNLPTVPILECNLPKYLSNPLHLDLVNSDIQRTHFTQLNTGGLPVLPSVVLLAFPNLKCSLIYLIRMSDFQPDTGLGHIRSLSFFLKINFWVLM